MWGFQFLVILDLWGISFHAVVVFGLGKDLLFKSVLGHCGRLYGSNFMKLNYMADRSNIRELIIKLESYAQLQRNEPIDKIWSFAE